MKSLRLGTLLTVLALGWALPARADEGSSASGKTFSMEVTDGGAQGEDKEEIPVYNFKPPPPARKWPKILMWTSFAIAAPTLAAALGCNIHALVLSAKDTNSMSEADRESTNNKIDDLNLAQAVLYPVGGVALVTALGLLWWYDGVPVENTPRISADSKGAAVAWSFRF